MLKSRVDFPPSIYSSQEQHSLRSRNLTLDLVDSLSQPTNVLARDTSNGDSAVLGSIHAVLLGQLVHLLRGQAGVGEHADLAGDVGPVVLGAELLEVLFEESAHGDDAVGHVLDLDQPLVVELGGVEDLGSDASAVNGGVGVQRADEDLDLRVDALLLIGVLGQNGEGTDALTVQTLFMLLASENLWTR